MSVAPQIDYQKLPFSYSNYTLSKITPIEGSQSRTISASGGDVLTFDLPPNSAYNLARSYLSFAITPAAGPNPGYNWIPVDTLTSLREIVIQTKGGLQLAYITNLDVYLKAVLKYDTKLSDLLLGDEVANSFNGLSRNDSLVAAAVRYDNTASAINYTEARYLVPGQNNTATPVIMYDIPLSIISNTIFSLDKDLLFGETLQIKITMNSANRLGWYSTSQTNPTSGATAIASYTITNPFLYLAIEKNETVVNALKMKVMSNEGMNLLFDYVYVNKTAFSPSTQQQLQLRYNRANGLRLKKIYYCLTPGTEATNTTYELSNINGAKVSSFYTMLNNIRRLDYNVSCASVDLEDWMAMRDKLRGSCIQSSNVYQYNWVWIESFDDGVSPLEADKNEVNREQGLDLNVEQKYDFVATTANNAHNHYAFSVCQKMLVANSMGIQIM
jgi:hypothetical protein